MKQLKKVIPVLIASFLSGILYGCGGGGGGGDTASHATVAFSSQLKEGYVDQVGSINLTLELPDGVTVPTDAAGFIPHDRLFFSAEGARFAANSTFAVIMGRYTPATASSKAKVKIVVNTMENSNSVVSGMNPGMFATLICSVAPGASVTANSFKPLSDVLIANAKADILTDFSPPLASLEYSVTF